MIIITKNHRDLLYESRDRHKTDKYFSTIWSVALCYSI